jgi:hypothetical protein
MHDIHFIIQTVLIVLATWFTSTLVTIYVVWRFVKKLGKAVLGTVSTAAKAATTGFGA